jgi:SprT-like family
MLKNNPDQVAASNAPDGGADFAISTPNSGSYDPTFGTRPIHSYVGLELAYAFFNRELFGGKLPPCLITFQRTRGAYGYFSGDRFVNVADPAEVTDEIALNPIHFGKQTPIKVLSTLVHEMAHLWQHHNGKSSRGRYHNMQWAKQMIDIGLVPSDTGKPGGKQTGDRVGHFIRDGGPFDRACREFLARDTTLLYQDGAYRERADDEGARRNDRGDVASAPRNGHRPQGGGAAREGRIFLQPF